ncbi:MAG TPA: CARDB domain-containing protein, partial [Acidobacteriota bacterium]
PDTQNSSIKIPVSLVAKMPDLAPKDVSVDKRGILSFSIANKGNSLCRDSVTAVYINGALVQRFNTRQLRAGDLQRFQHSATRVASGAQISIVADFNADTQEASEENNRLNYIVK